MRVGALVAAGLAALCCAPAATAAQPQPPTSFEDPAIEIDDLFTMNVAVPVASRPLYRSLFIDPLKPAAPAASPSQPDRPLMELMIHSVNGNGDGTGGTYENWVNLRGSYCGSYGWFNRATAVDSLALYVASRASGYPKVLADRISIRKTTTGWRAQTTQGGKPLVTLEWRRDPARLAALLAEHPWAREWVKGHGRAYDAPTWAFEPYPNEGPYVKWIVTKPDPKVPQVWTDHVGVVRVTLGQGADPALTEGNWMGLVPKTVEVPGVVEHYHGKGDFTAHRDTCPHPGKAPPPRPGGGSSRPRCVHASTRVRRGSLGPLALGQRRREAIARLGKPTGRSAHGLGWCLRGGGALLAALGARDRVRAAATTRVSGRLRKVHPHARRIGRGLYRPRHGPPRVIGARNGRITFALVTREAILSRPRALRQVLRDLGLRP